MTRETVARAGAPPPSLLLRWLRRAQWRAQPGRTLASIAAVAIGVALALAIHLVNATALSSFQQAIGAINGDADLRVSARSGMLDEALLDRLAAIDGIAGASPVIDVVLPVRRIDGERTVALRLIATEPIAAASVTPALVPTGTPTVRGEAASTAGNDSREPLPARTREAARSARPIVPDRPDQWWLSTAALRQLGLEDVVLRRANGSANTGSNTTTSGSATTDGNATADGNTTAGGSASSELLARTSAGMRRFSVAGIAEGIVDQSIALTDLGSAQWALGLVGRVSRIDLRVASESSVPAVRDAVARQLGDDILVLAPDEDSERMSNISRAYRVNLNVLALVALLTGGFIVFAAMSLAALRQQPVFALLTVLGARPGFGARALIGQAGWIGAVGAGTGVAAGIALATTLLAVLGADLGGGYFEPSRPRLAIDWWAVAGFAVLGWLTAVGGAAAPALATRTLPAIAILRSGALQAIEAPRAARRRVAAAAMLLALGVALALAPPVGGLPIPAYGAIAVLLFAGILSIPTVIAVATRGLDALFAAAIWRRPPAWLALAHQRQAATSVAIALAGVVASFALSVAMIVMVSSFRNSVDDWLDTVLPADWYARLAGAGLPVDARLQATVRQLAGSSRVEFLRAWTVTLDPLAPPVALLARDATDADALATRLPLTGPVLGAASGPSASAASSPSASAAGDPSARGAASGNGGSPAHRDDGGFDLEGFVSEPMVSRHGFRVGSVHPIPLDGRTVRLRIRGVWRDYARQGGAIAIARNDYLRLTGDDSVTDLALWPADGVDGAALVVRLRAADPIIDAGEWRSSAELRRISLAIFDRSFAITHVLEAVAILVGLFGVASTYAAQALTRAREFGMLRHLGFDRRAVIAQLAIEATVGTVIAVVWGAFLGLGIALVLIKRVNPQSFHWTMDITVPWPLLGAVATTLVATAVVTAMVATRSASSGEPVAALRHDG